MNLKHIILAATVAAVATTASAIPARRGERVVTQPDGSTVTLTLVGDEHRHYYLTTDDKMVINNGSGYYFATLAADGSAIAGLTLAADPVDRDAAQTLAAQAADSSLADALPSVRISRQQVAEPKFNTLSNSDIPQAGIGLFPGASYPTRGTVKGLVILVEYSDVSFNLDDPYAYFYGMLNTPGFAEYKATGSARDWFVDNSMGVFTPEFDVYGPVTLPNARVYYGGNDTWGNDKRPAQMIFDACSALDDTVDFSQYDTDGDGYVDNVYVFYAGIGEASSMSKDAADSVWPHQWELSSGGLSLRLDGVRIDRYACSNEWEDYGGKARPDGIGTFVHEFSHVMGLPDLYHTTSSANYTPGDWSVMDAGPYNNDSRTPPCYSAFERNALGWLELMPLDQTPRAVTLDYIAESNKACLIPTSKNTEFYLLENRQQKGWDAYIPYHGMLVWHVDYVGSKWTNNVVNNTKTHQYVDIVEANGRAVNTSTSNMKGWPFPGTGKVTSFTDDTTPSMKSWSGQALNTPVTNINEMNGIITFDVCGGPQAITPVLNEPTDITESSFVASWQPVDGATDYLFTVRIARDDDDPQPESDEDILDEYRNLSTGGDTSILVDKLIEGVTRYKYTVRYISAEGRISNESDYMMVELKPSSVDKIAADSVRVDVIGREVVIAGAKGDIRDLAGRTLCHGVSRASLAPGVYLVTTDTRTVKIIIR